jgi:Domain of unknown function DUF29
MAKVLERSLYRTDYYAWTKQQAAELRKLAAARVNTTLDLENLAEEVESLGRSDLATVRSQLRRIIEHLLKLEHSPAAEPRFGWRESIIDARDVIPDVITATLRREVEAVLAKTYQQGRRRAEAALMRLCEREAAQALPAACPYTFDQIVGQDWYPANRHGLVDDVTNA